MEWASAAATGSDLEDVLDDAVARVRAALGPADLDLAFAFVGAMLRAQAPGVPQQLAARLGGAHVLGCTAGGVIGGGRELEHVPALSLLAGRLPGAAAHGFALEAEDLPDPDAAPAAWHEALGVAPADGPGFVVLADPLSFPADALLQGIDYAYPGAVVVGGLASGAARPGEQVLFTGDRARAGGAVGVALMGDVALVPAVAQGCRPVGGVLKNTDCREHLLLALDGRPVLEMLRAVLGEASARDRHLAETSLFLGFETDPFAATEDAPWLIRNLLGVDPRSGGIFVGETLRTGRRVRFHVRDRLSSADDLKRTLERAAVSATPQPVGALLFSCLGRGMHLYGTPDHDTRVFEHHFHGVPLGGFFCSGEIGPVGGATRLHGYTSSFGLISARGQGA